MADNIIDGIVTRGHGNRFVVYADGRYIECQLRKKIKFRTEQTTPVAVGDDVGITVVGDNEGVIEEVRERRSVLSRPAVGKETIEHVLAANIDVLAIVVSINEPKLKSGLIDRFLIAADLGDLQPAIVINKLDLAPSPEESEAINIYRSIYENTFLTSALNGEGVDKLSKFLSEHRTIFAGHSGVGKSTLLNRMMPGLDLHTKEISKSTGRGTHATTHMELFHLPDGGFVIDSPGIKVLGFWQIAKEALAQFYPEMLPYLGQCKFSQCSHEHEPDCAVKEALKRGDISQLRYDNYLQIYHSL
jgi:ribosome biogenesis GTPase